MMKSLIRISTILALVAMVSWPFLSESRKQLLMSMASGEADWRQLVLVNPFSKQTIATAGPLVGLLNQQIAGTELGKELLAGLHGPQQYRCEPVVTREISDTQKSKMYRWQDDDGRWHFGDNQHQAGQRAEDVGARYQSKYQYFKLDLRGDDKQLPAFSRDKISAETMQIFSIMSDALSVDYLRQVDLNLRLIASQKDFQAQREKIAPGLKTNSGFYSTSNNEAVIWQAPNVDFMHAVIRHEASHVIMAGLYGYPPVWLNEGIAEYFEQLNISSNAKVVRPNKARLDKLQQGDVIPLKAYLALSTTQWRELPQQQMYGMAWGLVYFFMSDAKQKRFFTDMLASIAKNKCVSFSSFDYFEANYPQGVAGLQQQWKIWLRRNPNSHYY